MLQYIVRAAIKFMNGRHNKFDQQSHEFGNINTLGVDEGTSPIRYVLCLYLLIYLDV